MTTAEILGVATSCSGRRVETVRGKLCTVRVGDGGLYFTPESTGAARYASASAIQQFVDRYNETRSIRAVDYHDVTHNASYFIALVVEARRRAAAQ